MFRNIKTVKDIKPKAPWWVAFMDIQNISNHSPFIYKPTQEIHDKQVPIITAKTFKRTFL